LNYDGRITEVKVLENTVTETLSLLCQKAVLDPAPFDKWPREMRLMVAKIFRRITFTFYLQLTRALNAGASARSTKHQMESIVYILLA